MDSFFLMSTTNKTHLLHTIYRLFYINFRDTPWKGLSQMVNLTAGVRYSLSGYIKLLNVEPGALYHAVDLIVKCTDTQGTVMLFGGYKTRT